MSRGLGKLQRDLLVTLSDMGATHELKPRLDNHYATSAANLAAKLFSQRPTRAQSAAVGRALVQLWKVDLLKAWDMPRVMFGLVDDKNADYALLPGKKIVIYALTANGGVAAKWVKEGRAHDVYTALQKRRRRLEGEDMERLQRTADEMMMKAAGRGPIILPDRSS